MSQTDGAIRESGIKSQDLRESYPLSSTKIIKKTISSLFGLSLPGIFILVALVSAFGLGFLVLVLGIFLVFAVLVYLYQTYYFRNYSYSMTQDGLVISKGVISRWSITVPSHKVQDVYLDQDAFDRVFGLYDLHLATATEASGREAHIDGLLESDTNSLRRVLLEWAVGPRQKESQDELEQNQDETILPSDSTMPAYMLISLFSATLVFIYFLSYLNLPWYLVFLSPLWLIVSYLDFRAAKYTIRANGVTVRKGFLIPSESTFLYRNIQDVEDNVGWIESFFNAHTLIIKTMSSSSAVKARLPFLNPEIAKSLREKILLKCKSSSGELSDQEAKPDPSVPAADLPEKFNSPFRNHFFRSVLYSTAVNSAIVLSVALFAMVISTINGNGFSFYVPTLLFAFFFIMLIYSLPFANAFIMSNGYSYSIGKQALRVKFTFLGSSSRRSLFSKVQDLERHVSFSDSFAKLASINLDTGSKELVGSGSNQSTVSQSTLVEGIPALDFSEANKALGMLLSGIGVSIAGLNNSPLIARFPLEQIKPVKKTVLWILIMFGIELLLVLLSVFSANQVFLSLAFIFFMIAILAISAKYLYEQEYLKTYYYSSSRDALVIKKGVFGHRLIIIPFSKIQDVFVSRDILDMAFGLCDVHVSTATSRSVLDAHIDGVSIESAEQLAMVLLERIGKKQRK